MKIGYIGLGKMGLNMVLNAERHGHEVVSWNRGEEGRKKAITKGAKNVKSTVAELMGSLPKKNKIIWIMVSHSGVDEMINLILPKLAKGDLIIDGGNCFYKDTIRRAKFLRKKGIHFLDAGVSGGPGGAFFGACIMVGGEKSYFQKMKPFFESIAVKNGILHAGGHGAGHFVKMVHNGIEYGMMQAIAEGFEVMKKSHFKLNLRDVAKIYNHGSVVESRLIGWLENGFKEYGENLDSVSGSVAHTGEGEWTIKTAKKLKVPVPVISEAFNFRVRSAKKPSYSGKVLSTLRNQFGQHDIKANSKKH